MVFVGKACSAAVAVCALLGATVAQAATVERVSGSVRVSQGSGYKPVTGSVELRPGGTVMVEGKGQARIVYPDGCTMPVDVGTIATVGEVSPCTFSAQAGQPQQPPPPFLVPGALPGPEVAAVGLLAAAGIGIGIGLGTSNGGNGFRFPIQALTPTSP